MFKAVAILTLAVYVASAERISNIESPTWSRRTTEDPYAYGRDRESVRGASSSDTGSRWGSSNTGVTDRWGDAVTDRPGATGRFTYSWERSTGGRSSYLDSFTTQPSYESPYDRSRYDYTSRRPSYQTDRWGDVVSGTTRSPYVTWSSGRDQTNRWGDSASSWDRTTTRYGSRYDTTRSWSSGSDLSPRFDRNNAYVRIQVELVKFTNEKGITIDGNKCDTFGQCDPIVRAFIDTERPNAEFPGARDSKYWPVVFQTDNLNTFDFRNANVSRDVCGVPYREATLRVLIEDEDSINKNDLINKFDCPITSEPETGRSLISWHTSNCTPKQQATQMKLTFRYKVQVIDRFNCDPNSGVLTHGQTSTTKRRS